MGQCYITRRGTKTGGAVEQLGVYPTGNDGRPMGNVTVLDNVTTLSKYLFTENSNILSVALPQNLRGIEDYCFQNCISLQSISLSNKIDTIPQYCFSGCNSLSKVVLPKNLYVIEGYAFRDCTGLYDVIIPDEIKSLEIKGYAFSGCTNIDNETVTKLSSLTHGTIHSYAFANLKGITEITTLYSYDYYFYGCTNLRKVIILNSLSDGSCGSYVFNGCTNLREVVLPDNIQKIKANMFNGNSNLSTINFPNTITEIGESAFRSCTKLLNLDIPEDSSFSINGNYAFASTGITNDCAKNIISHANSVGSYVFQSCHSLTDVEVPIFSSYMFNDCTNLKSAISTQAMDTTGDNVFYGCTALERAVIADGTTTIGSRIFYDCRTLKTVYLPSSITTATNNSLANTSSSYYAFYNCTALEDVQLGQNWNMSIRLNVSNNLTVDSMVAMFSSLKDLTGETAKTLTLGSTNLAKLTDEQKAIAINKNWTLA